MIDYSESGGSLVFSVYVVPRSSRSEIVGEHNGSLRVRIAAPPVDGRANDQLVRTLARAFGVAPSAVAVISGHTGKAKRVRIDGASAQTLRTFC